MANTSQFLSGNNILPITKHNNEQITATDCLADNMGVTSIKEASGRGMTVAELDAALARTIGEIEAHIEADEERISIQTEVSDDGKTTTKRAIEALEKRHFVTLHKKEI